MCQCRVRCVCVHKAEWWQQVPRSDASTHRCGCGVVLLPAVLPAGFKSCCCSHDSTASTRAKLSCAHAGVPKTAGGVSLGSDGMPGNSRGWHTSMNDTAAAVRPLTSEGSYTLQFHVTSLRLACGSVCWEWASATIIFDLTHSALDKKKGRRCGLCRVGCWPCLCRKALAAAQRHWPPACGCRRHERRGVPQCVAP